MRSKLFFLTCFLAAACSGAEEGPKPDPLAMESDFCSEWGRRACNDEVVDVCAASDTESCVASQRQFCTSIIATGYQSDHAKACLDAVKTAYKDADLDAEELGIVLNLDAPCDQLIRGPSSEGDSCDEDSDCDTVNEFRCVIKTGEGTCQIPSEVGGGRSCSSESVVCEAGFFCDGSHCVEQLGEDEECEDDAECADGLGCDGGACVPRAAATEDCTRNADCESGICAFTSSDEGVCVDRVRLSPSEPICENLR
jgi:hypothetical protein